VHHAQTDIGIRVAVEQVGRVQVIEHFLEKHGLQVLGSTFCVGNDGDFDTGIFR
jgi:hypothetical protein